MPKFTHEFTSEATDVVTQLADKKGSSKSEVIRRALNLLGYVEEQKAKKSRILIRDVNGDVRESYRSSGLPEPHEIQDEAGRSAYLDAFNAAIEVSFQAGVVPEAHNPNSLGNSAVREPRFHVSDVRTVFGFAC